MLLALGALAAVAFWVWSLWSEQRAIRSLPEGERVALYERTLANLQSVCASPDPALADYCREQARILLEFPECDEACRELARLQIGRRSP